MKKWVVYDKKTRDISNVYFCNSMPDILDGDKGIIHVPHDIPFSSKVKIEEIMNNLRSHKSEDIVYEIIWQEV